MTGSLESTSTARTHRAAHLGPWHAMSLLRAHRAARRARWEADREIAQLDGGVSLRLAWRVDELVATKNRLDLAHAYRTLVRESSTRYLPSASPVNRGVARANAAELLALADRLAEIRLPVSARGVVLADRILTDGSGPLYDRERADELPALLDETLEVLERH